MRKIYILLVLSILYGTLQAQDPCPNNHSLDFNPTSPGSDYLQPASPPIVSGSSDFTLEARFRCESPAGSSFRRLLSMGGSGTGSAQFEVCESNGYLRFFWGTSVYPSGTPPANLFIKDGNWHHVAAVRSGSGFLIYIDGVLVFTSPTGLPALNNFTRLRIGAFWNGVSATTAWDGQIDEVRVWNTVRTPTQISTYRNCLLPTCSETGLMLYYKLDEGLANGNNAAVTLADDCSSNNNNGTLAGPFALTGTISNWVCGDSLFGTTCCPADFSWTRDSCGNVQFTNLTQQPVPPTYTYAWDFDDDGVTDSTLPNPSWNYPTQGNHTVCLSLITPAGAVFCETCETVSSLSFLTGPPIIVTCSPDISLSCGNPYQVPIPVVSNNYCSDQLNITGSRSDFQLMNAPFPLGITVITWTATNEFGSNTCTNTVTVFDNDIPVPLFSVLPDLVDSCGSLIVIAPAAIDPCNSNGGSSIIYGTPSAPVGILLNTNPPSYQLAPGNYVITWVYDDGNGNVITQPQNISVLMDNVPPVAICQNVVVNLSGSTVTVTPQMVDNGSFDDCCPVTLSFPNAPNGLTFSCQDTCPLPPQTVVLLVTDCNGNTSTCTAQVTLVDNSPPIVVCNDQIQIQVDASGFASISASDVLEGQAIDNCGISDLLLDTDGFGCDVACGPPQTVVLTAVDCSGNTSTCATQVFVFDAIAPIISCPANLSVSAVPGSCQATVSASVAFSDNCGVAFLEHTLSGATTGTAPGQIQNVVFNVGTTTCTYIVQDGCGNTATCSFTVTVFDFEPPIVIDCPQDISVTGSLAAGGTNVSWSEPFFLDNCTGFANWTSSHTSGDFFPCGETVVSYFAVDNFGNSAFCFFTVSVDCPPDVCQCGGFTNLTFGAAGTPAGLSVACNQAFTVPCPVAGTNFSIAGQFACSDTSCAASNLVWELHNSSGMISSGSLGGVNFTLPIAGNTIQTPGTYTLYLRGDCGQTTCQCEVLFVVPDCPETCENRALFFDGIDDVVTMSTSPIQGDADFTVEAMFTSTATNGGTCSGDFRRLFAFGGATSRFEIGECAGLMSVFWYNGVSNGPFQLSDQNIRDSNCHHIAAIRSGDSLHVLLDGTLVFLTGQISPLNSTFFRLGQWGGGPTPGQHWQGLIDEVRMWNYPRTNAEILANNSCELVGTESGLVGYWPMNQGIAEGNNPTETQCTDIAGNDQPGVLTNFALNGIQSNWVCGCELCKPSENNLACGDAVVTCYSGLPGASGVVAAIKKLQNVYILPVGTDLSGSVPTSKMLLKTELGEVFGIAIDNNNQGDIYFTSTTVYGPTGPGPNGYGGIYKVDGNTLLVDPAWVVSLPNLAGPAVTSAFTSTTHAPGLGNICYDRWNNQLFVTNFEDGRIYRIDPTGTGSVIDYFDPFGDNGLPGFAPVGKRPWGIDVTQNSAGEVEVHYAVWTVDKVRNGGGAYNSIRRVKLNPGGSFDTGSDMEIIQLPYTISVNYSNPVSDIAFSQDGQTMLLAERTMDGDMKPNNAITAVWAHQSRLLRYEKTGSTWSYDQTIPIGEYGSGTFGRNSAGGVDFGNYVTATDSTSTCDTSIWCTGDYLKIFWPNKVYGMQGFYEDNIGVTNANSWLLDFDGLLAQYDKSLLGDVEIFKCIDCPIVDQCEGISAVAVPDSSKTGCCYTLNIGNQTPGYFTYVNISVIDGGSLVTSPPPAAGTGWTLQGYSGSSAIFQPVGGTIPAGSQQVADFCLENLTADEQTIVIEYYGLNDSVVCRDTLTLRCDACVQAFVDSVYCESWNVYQMSFCVKAGDDLDWTIGSISIHPPAGVTFTPDVFSLPALVAGQTYCYLTTTVTGGTPGQEICFSSIVHHEDIAAGELDLSCCADTVPVCFILPNCDPCDSTTTYATAEQVQNGDDSCCWKITLHNPPGYYIGVSTEIITPGVTFGAVNNFPPTSGWFIGSYTPTAITWDPFGVQGTHVQDGWMMPVICFDGTVPGPWELAITWYAEDSTECYDTLSFLCTPPDDNDCVRLDTFDLVCIDDSTYIFNFTATNVSSDPAITGDHVVLGQIKPTPPPYNVFDPATHWQTLLPNASGSFSSLLYGNPGDTVCFVIAMHDVNDDSLHLYCCVSDTFCIVLPPCDQGPECADNIVQNGDFQQGTVTGDLGFDGNVDFWNAVISSSPQVSTAVGCAQNGSVHMWGNQVVGEGISQVINFQQGFAYDLSLCATWIDQVQPNVRIRVRATDGDIIEQGDYLDCNLPECEEIFLTPILTTSWQTYVAPSWTPQNNYNRLVLTVWNNSNVDDGAQVSWARVDDICIEESQLPIQFSVRAFPNPTSGDLTLAFERAAPKSATLRVFDMFGRLVKTERVAEAQLQHELSLNGLSPGVYFVEIGDSKTRLWGQRIVKE